MLSGGQNFRNTFSTKIQENAARRRAQHGTKFRTTSLTKPADAKPQAQSRFVRAVIFSETHFQRRTQKHIPKHGIPNRPKSVDTFVLPNACGSSCFAGGCLGRRERPNLTTKYRPAAVNVSRRLSTFQYSHMSSRACARMWPLRRKTVAVRLAALRWCECAFTR